METNQRKCLIYQKQMMVDKMIATWGMDKNMIFCLATSRMYNIEVVIDSIEDGVIQFTNVQTHEQFSKSIEECKRYEKIYAYEKPYTSILNIDDSIEYLVVKPRLKFNAKPSPCRIVKKRETYLVVEMHGTRAQRVINRGELGSGKMVLLNK